MMLKTGRVYYGYSTHNYYMASFCAAIGYWSKMELSCLLRTTCHVLQETFPQKPYNKSFIDQACPVKVAEYWLCLLLFLASLSRSIHMQERTWAILACVASNSVGLGTKEGPRNGIFSVGPCEKWCKSQISTHFDLTLGKWLIYKIFLPTSNNI